MKNDNKPLELNRFLDSDSSKSYVIGCDWESSSTLVNCELAASFEITYIDFIFFFYFLFRFTGIFEKKIYIYIFFLFLQCSRFLNHLAHFLDHRAVAKIGQYNSHLTHAETKLQSPLDITNPTFRPIRPSL
jgi:hypothetical protein